MTGATLASQPHGEFPMHALRRALAVAVLVLLAFLSGCATVPPNAGQDPRDPLESFNRQVFEFNEGLDKVVLKPLAQAYDKVVPVPVQECLSNGFSNLREPSNALNNLLQGKAGTAVSDVCRFAINTTVGLLGCFDVATRMGLEKSREDFGQTLAVWGVGNGPFLMLPLFGPSTIRDTAGLGVETVLDVNFWIDNVSVRNTIFGVRTVSFRHELLKTDDLISGAALDRYTFIRDGYLQRRRNLVYDGNPPREKDPDDEEDAPNAEENKDRGMPGPPAADSGVKPPSAPKPAQ
ncbi:MAG: VacJ family lipoprotein [Betaproteobacteria bacterium]